MKPERAEMERLKKEVAKLKMERAILNNPRPISRRRQCEVRLRGEAPRGRAVNPMREALCVSRGGLYAWLSRRRAQCKKLAQSQHDVPDTR